MRVIQVLHSRGYGGAENHALVLSRALGEAGHDVLLACPEGSWLAQHAQAAGIAVRALRMAGLYDPVSHWRLRRWVKGWQPDVVHGHLIRGSYYAGWAATARAGAVAVSTAHATTAHKHMERCRRIIAVSGAVRDSLMAHGHAADRIDVVHNGMPDVPEVDRAVQRRVLGIPDDRLALVNVGRFVRDKGQDVLVEALGAMPPQAHLYLVGDPATAFGQQVQALAEQHAPERVHFLGYRGDVPSLLPAFDIYLSGSRREALGLSLVEAAAARLPVVATAVGGVPEVVLEGRSGLLVPSEDAVALARAVVSLASDLSRCRALGDAGRRHYLQQFTVQAMVAGTLQAYAAALR